jgi:hypothetical protein
MSRFTSGGAVLGLDRRYVVREGTIEVIDRRRSRGARDLDPDQAARIDKLAASTASVDSEDSADLLLVGDSMETDVVVKDGDGPESTLVLRSGDDSPSEVWELVGEVTRASGV